jgi:tetratricopeptide (TPR) repeat protein
MKKLALLLLLLGFGVSLFAQTIEEANTLYANKKYNEAYDAYSALESEWPTASTYWYNRGNAAYKLGKVAVAVWCYEKALQLNPSNDDVLFNLELARNNVVDKITVSPSHAFTSKVNRWMGLIPNVLLTWGNVLFLALAVMFLLLFRKKRSELKLRSLGYTMAILYLSTLALSLIKDNMANNLNEAIVSHGRLSIQAEPNTDASALFILHEGTKVGWTETTSNNEWVEIELSDGRQGWCEKKDLLFI